jgi:hypothetical protein
MKTVGKRKRSRSIEITGYVISYSLRFPSVTTLHIALDTTGAGINSSLAFVNVKGPLADLCRNELRLGDQIKVEGMARARSLPSQSGVLHPVLEIEAVMVTPIHSSPVHV